MGNLKLGKKRFTIFLKQKCLQKDMQDRKTSYFLCKFFAWNEHKHFDKIIHIHDKKWRHLPSHPKFLPCQLPAAYEKTIDDLDLFLPHKGVHLSAFILLALKRIYKAFKQGYIDVWRIFLF